MRLLPFNSSYFIVSFLIAFELSTWYSRVRTILLVCNMSYMDGWIFVLLNLICFGDNIACLFVYIFACYFVLSCYWS